MDGREGKTMSVFETLNGINVNEHTEKKNGLTYLSWAWAWQEVKKRYASATYKIWRTETGEAYVYDENLGYMVHTSVTIEGETLDMWLPVMDSANNAMKDKPYTIKTKYKEIEVKQATMFDINKTIMRCLVKNIGMFGLGLYIYAGEDLPEDISESKDDDKSREDKEKLVATLCEKKGKNVDDMCAFYKATNVSELSDVNLDNAIKMLSR